RSGDDLLLLGRQPHTAALIAPTRNNSTALYPKLRLVLAPLQRRLPESLLRLHERGDAIAVPTSDRATFRADYLPRLRQQIPLTSSDGSLELPEELPPRLEVVVTWTGVRAELLWQWLYGGAGGSTFAIDSDERAPAVRRPLIERALLAAVEGWTQLQPRAS